ncbi:MAG: STAS domain-containing protein [Clostridia bacterium]|nr:STAS domain-containing protein [Clostridia bacterium]
MEEVKIIGLKDGNLEIALSGDIDLGNAEAFYQAVMTAYKQETANLTFDCEALDFIDSTTLGTFVKILKAVKMDGKNMKLVKLQPKIKKLFMICSLNTIMEIE